MKQPRPLAAHWGQHLGTCSLSCCWGQGVEKLWPRGKPAFRVGIILVAKRAWAYECLHGAGGVYVCGGRWSSERIKIWGGGSYRIWTSRGGLSVRTPGFWFLLYTEASELFTTPV